MLDQIDQIKNLLESIVIESELVAEKFAQEKSERLSLKNQCDFLRKELDMQDARNLDKSKTIDKLRKTQCDIEERELAMLGQLMDVQVALDRLREKFVARLRETDYCQEHNSIFEKCEFCRGKAQAWNVAIMMLDGMVQGTFWGDAE